MTRKSDISVISRLQRYARLLLPCILCAAVAAGCADRSDDTPSVPAAGFRAGFYITTAATNSPSLSRAPQPGTYEPGTADENYIDIDGKDFAIYFFDSSDAYVGSLTNVLITPADSDGRYKTYYVSGTVSDANVATLSGSLKVVILANWGDYPALAPGDPISRIAAHTPASMTSMSTWRPGRDGYIPMYGVSNLITGVSFRDGWQTDLGTLHMLRALAQIRVREDVSTGGLRISSLRLTRANTAYMRAPAGVTAQDHYVKGNYAGDYYKTPSIPAAPAEVADVEMHRDADGTYRIYVPEYRNIASGTATSPLDSRARLAVVFETESVVRYVDFKYYDTPPSWAGAARGDHFDILRNNIYDYTLTHIDGDTDMLVEVDVIPYTEIKLRPDFGLERDNETGWIIIKKYDPAVYYYDDRVGQYYDGDKHAMPMRVSALPDDGSGHRRYSVINPLTDLLKYVYDYDARRYYLDTECTRELTRPDQCTWLPRQSLMDKENIVVLITDEYGKAIFMYDPVQNTYFNEIWSPLATPPNFGYQHWTHPRTGAEYMVIKVDYKENPVFFYDPATDRYYENDTKEEGFDLTEVQAFPPKE